MPIFDFHCPVCGAKVEKFIRKETEVICTKILTKVFGIKKELSVIIKK
jgi:hypothetical protein